MEPKLSPEQTVQRLLGDKYKKLTDMRNETQLKEKFLDRVLEGKYNLKYYDTNLSHFVVLRKWNSWYPSFFDTIGGCYVLILPYGDAVNPKRSVIVIDPGFKFLDSLRKYGVEARDVSSVIVTHFHPDHAAGLTEFLTLTHKLKHQCDFYLNETTFDLFKNCHTGFTKIKRISEYDKLCLGSFPRSLKDSSGRSIGVLERLYLEPKKAYHREMGDNNQSLGLQLAFEVSEMRQEKESGGKNLGASGIQDGVLECGTTKVGILGDTDGNVEYFPRYLDDFSEVNVLVLHLGTMSAETVKEKYAKGDGHLYDIGTILLLDRIKREKKRNGKFVNLHSVILSEFGLEMASIHLLLQTMHLFSPPNEWQAFLNLFDRLNEETASKIKTEVGQQIFDFEKNVFARLCLYYFISPEAGDISEASGHQEEEVVSLGVPILIGMELLSLNPTEMRKCYSELYPKLKSWASIHWKEIDSPSQFRKMDAPKTLMAEMFAAYDLKPIQKIEETVNSLVQCLVGNESSNIKTRFTEKLESFVVKMLRNYLRSVLRGDDRTVYGYSEIRKTSPFIKERFSNSKTITPSLEDSRAEILFCSCVFLLKTLCRAKEVKNLNSGQNSQSASDVPRNSSITIFDGFQSILQSCLEGSDVNVLIGDLGLDLVFEPTINVEKKCIEYVIKARGVDEQGTVDYRPIKTIRSKEIMDSERISRSEGNEKYCYDRSTSNP